MHVLTVGSRWEITSGVQAMKVLIALMILQFATTSYAAEGSYKLYDCKSEADANGCNSKCKYSGETLDIKVNVNNNVVLISAYSEGKLHASVSLESCKVVNEQNWICEPERLYDKGLSVRRVTTMTNGIMHDVYESKSKSDGQSSAYNCAKKTGFSRYFGF